MPHPAFTPGGSGFGEQDIFYDPAKTPGYAFGVRPELSNIFQRKAHHRGGPALEAIFRRQRTLEGLLSQQNPFQAGITGPLQGALTYSQTLRGGLDQLPELLQRSALASTVGAQVGAVNAARTAAGGRGGLAFGGGAGAIAARAARGAATDQASALANALASAEQAKAQYGLQQASLESGLASGLSQAILSQAGLFEGRLGMQAGAITNLQDLILQSAFGGPQRQKGPHPTEKFRNIAGGFKDITSGIKDLRD